jgi:hypothetical protein
MIENLDAWKKNLHGCVEELQKLLLEYMTLREDQTVKAIEQRIAGLTMMFPPKQAPPALRTLEGALHQFHEAKHHPQFFLQLMRSYEALRAVASINENERPSFDEIFGAYKQDEDLQSLANQLVSLLERLLQEADDLLSAQIARELRVILEQLQKRDKRSLYELQTWVELGAKALVVVIETYTGAHGLSLVKEAIQIALRIRLRLIDRYAAAQKQTLQQHGLTYVEKALEKFPELPTEDQVQKYLKAPDDSGNKSS